MGTRQLTMKHKTKDERNLMWYHTSQKKNNRLIFCNQIIKKSTTTLNASPFEACFHYFLHKLLRTWLEKIQSILGFYKIHKNVTNEVKLNKNTTKKKLLLGEHINVGSKEKKNCSSESFANRGTGLIKNSNLGVHSDKFLLSLER